MIRLCRFLSSISCANIPYRRKTTRWKDSEIEFLLHGRKNGMRWVDLAKNLNRSAESCRTTYNHYWTINPHTHARLKKLSDRQCKYDLSPMYGSLKPSELLVLYDECVANRSPESQMINKIACKLQRSKEEVQSALVKVILPMLNCEKRSKNVASFRNSFQVWTKSEFDFLRENALKDKVEWQMVATKLGRSVIACVSKWQRSKESNREKTRLRRRCKVKRVKWDDEIKETVAQLLREGKSYREIGAELEISASSIKNACLRHKLRHLNPINQVHD